MRELFIYWRVDAAQADAALAAAAAMQTALTAQHAGLVARLYRRADPGERVTLMETYAMPGGNDVADGGDRMHNGLDATLQATLIADTAQVLQAWCQDQRHVEAFDAVAGPR